ADMIRLFSYDVDFQRDIRSNDHFEIMFGQDVTNEGLVVTNGNIEYAAMTLRGETIKIYAFKHSEGETQYYNEEGKGIRKALMRTPINGARLSSSFGRRKHPVLGYTKMHRGVDFAAPRGTPIYAAGDGVIEKRQRWSSFGNYIRIRHGDGFATAYAHMNNFAKGYAVGSRVRQGAVIGYVGTTGRSTGPHLHYEVLRNGTQVNPMQVRFPASKTLDGEELKNFQRARAAADQKWLSLSSNRDIASLEPTDVILTLK
ncbi:MAG: peptidoglycan DD-metalloendopeptidase family protein, partial [Rhodospirillaceae bacterium]